MKQVVQQRFIKTGGTRGDLVAVPRSEAGRAGGDRGLLKLRNDAVVTINNKVQPSAESAPKPGTVDADDQPRHDRLRRPLTCAVRDARENPMKFTDIFINKPVLAIVVSLFIICSGLRAFSSLNVREYPELQNAVINVSTSISAPMRT